jgi:lysophospholipase L1-like esterase
MRYNRIFLFFLIFTMIFCGCQQANAAKEAPENDPVASITFLGDSITAHMQSRADVSPAQIWATKERYLNLDSRITHAKILAPDTGKEERIAQLAARVKPRILLITLGIDYGVYYYRNAPDTFAHYYEKLLDTIAQASPDTVLLLQSIFPVTAACTPIKNEMIDRANSVIREIAARRGLAYLDTQSVLRDKDGYLRTEFCNSTDGIHLSEQAYEAILSYIDDFGRKAGYTA